jgi:hypothetical protein
VLHAPPFTYPTQVPETQSNPKQSVSNDHTQNCIHTSNKNIKNTCSYTFNTQSDPSMYVTPRVPPTCIIKTSRTGRCGPVSRTPGIAGCGLSRGCNRTACFCGFRTAAPPAAADRGVRSTPVRGGTSGGSIHLVRQTLKNARIVLVM